MRLLIFALSLLGPTLAASTAYGDVLERVKSEGIVRCGSVAHPGLAEPAPARSSLAARSAASSWLGLNVEICRAIAVAVLGPSGRFQFQSYETQQDFDAVRKQEDEVFFLTGSDIVEQNLAGALIPGPAVYYETHAIMVPELSAAKRLEDLNGAKICFVIGTGAQRSLESFFEAKQLPFFRAGFSESDEMYDAYQVGHCDAVADELTALAKSRRGRRTDTGQSRILQPPLAAFPFVAATPLVDGKWAAIVAWTVHTLMRGEIREGRWRADGAQALPIEGLGLDQGWQKRVIETLGSYGDIFSRTLGEKSPYGLARGLNAPSREGGLFLAPYSE